MDTQTYFNLLRILNANLPSKATHSSVKEIDPNQDERAARSRLTELRKMLHEYLCEDDLRTLCFDLGIHYEDLPGNTFQYKTVALVQQCERKNLIPDLTKMVKREYPHVPLTDVSVANGEPLPVYKCLCQSLRICEAGNAQQMLGVAQICQDIAHKCKDYVGEAAALIHIGIAHAQMNQFDKAITACEKAKRLYHRNTDRRQRRDEGITEYGLGLIFQHHSTWLYTNQAKPMGDLQIKATGCYKNALDLFKQAEHHYMAIADEEQISDLWEMCQDIRQRIDGQIPEVYVDGKQYRLVPTEIASKTSSNLPPGVHCWAVLIGGDAGKEYGIVSGDGILIYILEEIEDTKRLPMVHTDSKVEAEFRRDAQGRIWYIPPGGDESKACYVDAVLKPADQSS